MRKLLVFQQRKGVSHGNPVIPAQGGPFCFEEIPVNIEPKPVFFKINVHMALFFAYHVQMALDNDRFGILIPFGAFLKNNYVVAFILHPL